MRDFKKVLGLALAAGAMLAAGPVLAHARLISSTPSAKSTIGSPRTLSVTFDDSLVRPFSKLDLVMLGHNMKVPVSIRFTQQNKTIVAVPQKALMKGSYVLNWTAATPDGHRMTGMVPFQVR